MYLFATIMVAIAIAIKAYFDNKNWGNVDHIGGILGVLLFLGPVALVMQSFYPLFLFGLLWNLVINRVRGLPVFYIGDTAWTDKILKRIFGKNAGEAFALIMLILTIGSLL